MCWFELISPGITVIPAASITSAPAVSNDQAHFPQVLDVLQGISLDDEHVGELADLERPDLVRDGEDLPADSGRRLENVLVAEPGICQKLQLHEIIGWIPALVLERDVGADADLDSRRLRLADDLDVALMRHREAARHREEEPARRDVRGRVPVRERV